MAADIFAVKNAIIQLRLGKCLMIQCLWERLMIQLSLRVSYDTVVSERVL